MTISGLCSMTSIVTVEWVEAANLISVSMKDYMW